MTGATTSHPSGSLPRPEFAEGDPLTAPDLQSEQDYRVERVRRHLRYLHGGGIICGLRVVPAGDSTRPWAVFICPGYAVTCCGDEIVVLSRVLVDLRDYLWTRPLAGAPPPAVVRLRYVAEPTRPVPRESSRCGCDEDGYRPSRLRDGFAMSVSWETAPASHVKPPNICAGGPVACPSCADDQGVVLAAIRAPADEADSITMSDIMNSNDS